MSMQTYYDQVKEILTQYPVTRDDDMKLYGVFLWKSGLISKDETFYQVCGSAKSRKLPTYEGVTRSRRKVQEKEPELRGKRYAERKHEEDEYRDYYGSDL